MGFFGLFKQKSERGTSAGWVPLTVLYVTDRDGLSPENGFALRNIILAAAPLDFYFLNPGSFEVFFPGNEDGKARAEQLAVELNAFASEYGASVFGVGIEVGPCLLEQDANGQFTSRPMGEIISRAMQTAIGGVKNV